MISGDNQSGSASLTMALRYWDWTGNAIRDLQPKSTDPNILPAEILNYVESKTNLKAIQRTAGDINTIKRLVYAGIPVIVETGLQVSSDQPWSSQYELITGFDDDWESVSILASYDIPGVYAEIGYIDFSQDWQAYNNLFIVIFPPSLQDRVDRILGAGTSFTPNDQYSSQTGAVQENVGNILYQFYDLYYQGTIEMQLNDYQLASSIYDQAFNILNHLTYDGRPWQFLASKSFPYQAYFYTKQYLRIIDLATQILRNNQNQEESYYWRSLAENALGDRNSAIIDMSRAVRIDPNFKLGVAWLARYRDGG
jgi:tetratricopeptide (TPR) repeat protein